MKIIKLDPKPGNDRDEFAAEADAFEYQGKRRDQVEGSYKIFAFTILAFLIVTLLYLVSHG